jgi:hypothetical protein
MANDRTTVRIRCLVIDTPEDPAKPHRNLHEHFLADFERQ